MESQVNPVNAERENNIDSKLFLPKPGRTLPSIGRNHWVRRTATSWWSGSHPRLSTWRPLSSTPAMPHAIFSASYPSGNSMYMPRADLRNMFGFADGIAHPAVEGSGIPGTNPYEVPLKAGEFVLGYEDEFHNISPMPQPEVLRRKARTQSSGSCTHAWPPSVRYLRQHAKNSAEEEWLSAKIVGRWPSGAPLALAPDKDDPELGADPKRNNAFMFGDDPRGLNAQPARMLDE